MAHTNTTFLVHHRLSADENLPRELWEEAEAPTKIAAIKCVLERPENFGKRPEVVYVSEGAFRWRDGTPGCVERFSLKWGEEKI